MEDDDEDRSLCDHGASSAASAAVAFQIGGGHAPVPLAKISMSEDKPVMLDHQNHGINDGGSESSGASGSRSSHSSRWSIGDLFSPGELSPTDGSHQQQAQESSPPSLLGILALPASMLDDPIAFLLQHHPDT